MPDTMKPEVKAQWIAALRNGEYQQGQMSLSKDGKFCCLGVLCDLAVKAGVIPAPSTRNTLGDDLYGTEDKCDVLPAEVKVWAGLVEANPGVDMDQAPAGTRALECAAGKESLAGVNDSGTPFALIADIIDRQF
jgi:hypothetical protein